MQLQLLKVAMRTIALQLTHPQAYQILDFGV
jgi:hypothetical protein